MGTTADKLTYLNDTKVLIRNKLNKFGAELTNENTFRSYATFLEDLYNDYPIVSDVGSNVTLSNTRKAPLKKLDLNSTELTQDGTPTPDNPIDVNTITGSNNIKISNSDNTEEQNYPITLSSKNLFNINGDVNTRYNGQTGNYNSVENNNLTTTYSTNNGYPYGQRIYVGTGKKVTISGIVTDINATGSKSALIMCFNDNTATGTQIVAFDATEINTRKSFSFTPNTDYIIVAFAGRYTGFVSATFTDIQVEYGETATPYMPYIENSIEYCKIGDYADQIFKNTTDSEFYDGTLLENEWYLKKNIISYKIEKKDTWDVHINSRGVRVFAKGGMPSSYINFSGQKCNYFRHTDSLYNYGDDNTFQIGYGWLYIGANKFANGTELNEFLNTHNVVCKIPTTSPEYIHISETDYPILRSQLENLYNNAKSYKGQTNITQTNDGLPFNIELSALMKGE